MLEEHKLKNEDSICIVKMHAERQQATRAADTTGSLWRPAKVSLIWWGHFAGLFFLSGSRPLGRVATSILCAFRFLRDMHGHDFFFFHVCVSYTSAWGDFDQMRVDTHLCKAARYSGPGLFLFEDVRVAMDLSKGNFGP